jgi:hypothetical protein
MSKTSPRSPFGSKTGTVTVLETHVLRNVARDAKVAFYLVGIISAVLATTVGASYLHPILAILLGGLIGLVLGGLAWTLVKIWPVVRLLWWWATEICLGVTFVSGWTLLASHTPLWLRLPIVASLAAAVTLVPAIRSWVLALYFCVAVRHRLRVCFSQFIIRNRSGSLPLILWARPTPVGERVWIFLRPGLSQADLTGQLDRLAVACWATAVTVDRPGDNAAFLRIDIKRREVLTHTITTPLVDLVDPATPARPRATGTLPTALNLADIPAEVPLVTRPAPKPANGKPTAPPHPGMPAPDDNEWI